MCVWLAPRWSHLPAYASWLRATGIARMTEGPYQPPTPGASPAGGGAFTPPPPGTYQGPEGGGPRPDGLGIAGLILGILALIASLANLLTGLFGTCCVVCTVGSTFIAMGTAVPAIAGGVMGMVSMKRTRAYPRHYSGWGLALAAAIVSGTALVLCLVEIVLPWLGYGVLLHTGTIHTTHPTPIIFPSPP